jgi:hypothetical protein
MYRLIIDLRKQAFCDTAFPFGTNVHLTLKYPVEMSEIENVLISIGHKQCMIEEINPNIEDCFMSLTLKA